MLIKCPECGKEISSETDKCINCGYPMVQKRKEVPLEAKKKKKSKSEKTRIILGILIFMCVVVMQAITGFNLPIYYVIAGTIILILRKRTIGSILCLIPLMIGSICFTMSDNYNSIVGGICWIITIGVIASIFVKEQAAFNGETQ